MIFDERADALRLRLLKPWNFKAYLWGKLPLAACAGLSLRQLDESGCTVGLPGGWRTQNPFRSTYFAAQAMAAVLWIIAVLANLTAIQRVVYTYVELKKGWTRMPEKAGP